MINAATFTDKDVRNVERNLALDANGLLDSTRTTNGTSILAVRILLQAFAASAGQAVENTLRKRNTNYGYEITPIAVESIRDWKSEARQELNSYLFLEEGWDGEEGIPPSPVSIKAVVDLIDKISSNFRLHPMVGGDGEVGFYSSDDTHLLTLSFWGEEEGVLAFSNKDTNETFPIDVKFSSDLVEKIHKKLTTK